MSDESLITKIQVARLLDCTTRQVERYEANVELPLPIADRAPVGSRRGHLYDPLSIKQWELDFEALRSGVTSDKGQDYAHQRARLTKFQADKTELEVAEIRAQVVRMPLVEQHWQGMVALMRARLLALPSKAAAMVSSPEHLQTTTDTIQDLVYEALTEIAGNGLPDETRRRAEAFEIEIGTEKEMH